ncbi:NACHT, LRR and PYD domains-containing protein 3-like [Sardina pilchardus]|uniref:NACHT, LRR and PYD domains-containing protein 3-like n=1 Tax=Sardina pilchardus TaxID=27697 RepID=UPI002E0DACE2
MADSLGKLLIPQTAGPPSPVPSDMSSPDRPASSRELPSGVKFKQKHKSDLQKKYQCLIEGNTQQGDTKLLHEIYTEVEVYITEGEGGEVIDEHNVRQMQRVSCKETAVCNPIKCSDIFKPLSGQDKPLRKVLTKGVAGIGKTVSVRKFILDWAEGKSNQDVDFIFPLPFRELNLMKENKLSLVDLIQYFFPDIKDPSVFTSTEHKVMFIFDGLNECRLPLDFCSTTSCSDVTEPALVDVLLTNLIKGDLLPSALLWITTRPTAAGQIPPECVDRVTDIRGFNDPQKDEYFKKKISDKNLASKTITHLKSSKSLYIMCHIPVFCWMSTTFVERTSKDSEKVEMPKTLTQMYTHFLVIQTSMKNVKYTERKETDDEVISKLGKLAFQQLEKGNPIFYEEDLRECDIDVTEASVYNGVCTQTFREESGKVFSFVHLSIQEFCAALYVFLCFSNRQRNMSDQQQTTPLSTLFRAATLHDLHKAAVDLALQSKNGHLDHFVRFLLGLSLKSNQNLLKHLLPQSSSQSNSSEQSVQYVKQKIRDQSSSDRRINLFYCLNELNHHAVVEGKSSSGTLYVNMLLPGEWKTTKFEFKISEEQLAEFDLQKYIKTPEEDQTDLLSPGEVLQKLLPVVTTCTSATLVECKLSEKSCRIVASVLQSPNSLVELNLSHNDLGDSGVHLLSKALSSRHCKLCTLRFAGCMLTDISCDIMASALYSLQELDLSNNDLGDSVVHLLFKELFNTHCKLETLRLAGCKLTDESCDIVASVLQSPNNDLRQSPYSAQLLDLSNNDLGDSGVLLLSKGLSSTHFNLLADCKLTDESCDIVASVLQSPNNDLRQLDLSHNELRDSGVQLLSKGLSSPHCRLQTLRLSECTLSKKCSEIVATVLQSPNSLIKLDLSHNDLEDSGFQLLSNGLSSSHCKLQTLRLSECTLSKKCSEIVATVLQSPNSLIKLDLSHNDLEDSGFQLLSNGLSSSHCKLQTLRLAKCKLSEKSFENVATALQSPNSLIELDLNHNDLGDSGVQLLSKGLSSHHCRLQTVRLSDCLISDEGCICLASALTSNPSHLIELDLSYNHPGESGLKLLSARLEDPHCKLEILKTDDASELTLDPNTAGRKLSLSEENRKVTCVREEQLYPDHPERFDLCYQVLCREDLSGRCYWEAEWGGDAARIAMAYKSIQRGDDIMMGCNAMSWSLRCSPDSYSAWHNNKGTVITAPSSGSRRVGVYLDRPAGTLSFYSVSSDTLTHLHTFYSTFTEPLCPGFWVWSSVSLCQILHLHPSVSNQTRWLLNTNNSILKKFKIVCKATFGH